MASSSLHSHLETTKPLLSNHDVSSPDHHEISEAQTSELNAKSPSLTKTIALFMTLHFLLAFTELLLVAPLLKLYEESVCERFYDGRDGGFVGRYEDGCQVTEVQRDVARIRGWKSMWDGIVVLLVTIPFGKLGDYIGRKKVIAIALTGVFFSLSEIFVVCAFPKIFPLQLIWLSSAILLCGGGLNSASSYMWGLAAECIPATNRQATPNHERKIADIYHRSHAFYLIFSAFYIAEMIASTLAALTTDISPWIPCVLSLLSTLLALILLPFFPSPSPSSHPSSPSHPTSPSNPPPSLLTTLHTLPPTPLLTIPVLLVGILRYTTLTILIQYAHIHFSQKISAGAAYYTETALINTILFLFLIPKLTSYIRLTYKTNPEKIDLFLVRASVALMCAGSLMLGLLKSNTYIPIAVAIFASGFGSRVSALALISYSIPAASQPVVYAGITVLESAGHAVGDPLMLHVFAGSLDGRVFFVVAGFYFCAVVSTSFIRITEREREDERERVD
ncbi:MFS general substrate transporter [Glarea lozoyensis ATCC 20868]|uniref:MFS general substrate transporter n=1 Tax=Glarea lozoyensis (strain ATCC 20868 / MF5171) TaxID=1116229 RepID=S3DCU6_GLAL2|nr:MFS general substrate transporter [Glarea lozoyensis ATCC 20868]EPE34909.1 MFS general substrate transporter [Glarea lozoyensis ATCC 20868]